MVHNDKKGRNLIIAMTFQVNDNKAYGQDAQPLGHHFFEQFINPKTGKIRSGNFREEDEKIDLWNLSSFLEGFEI